jgi:hypothetical protein
MTPIFFQGEHMHTVGKGRMKRVGRNQPTQQMVKMADIQRVFRHQAMELAALDITIPGKCTHTRKVDAEKEKLMRYHIAPTSRNHEDTTRWALYLLEDTSVPVSFNASGRLLCSYYTAHLSLELYL